MPLKIVLLRPKKLVSTKSLLLKHYYRRQGYITGFFGLRVEFAIIYARMP